MSQNTGFYCLIYICSSKTSHYYFPSFLEEIEENSRKKIAWIALFQKVLKMATKCLLRLANSCVVTNKGFRVD